MEPTHRLDVLGHYCPVPVRHARKSLEKMKGGEVLELLADDPETLHDVPILIDRLGHRLVDIIKVSGEIKFIIEVCR